MSEQVTLETHLVRVIDHLDGAWHGIAVTEAGKLGLVETKHGAPDRWDWGATARSLLEAQDRWRQAGDAVRAMTPEQRAALWTSEGPHHELLRRVARRMA